MLRSEIDRRRRAIIDGFADGAMASETILGGVACVVGENPACISATFARWSRSTGAPTSAFTI
jgi:hypothetical protein